LNNLLKKIKLSKAYLIFYFLLLVFSSSVNSFGQALKKSPNILFIAVDDLKPILGCYGDKMIKTPNIDRLGSKGTIFLSNYCQQAVCGPTRASLLTGKRPDYTRIWDLKTKMRDENPDILTLPQYFINQGYTTTGVGKVYDQRCVDNESDAPSWSIPFHQKPDEQYYNKEYGEPSLGFYQSEENLKLIDHYKKEAKQKGEKNTKAYIMKYVKPSVESADVPDDAYLDGATVNQANEIMNNLAKDSKPFFLAVGIHNPHLPFVAPKKYWDMYKREDMPLAKFQEHSKNSPDFAYHNSAELRAYTDIPPLTSFSDIEKHIGLTTDKQKELIHGYYAAVSYADAVIGELLKNLEQSGLGDNTIIVLWGDHGWHLGDHDLWCKHTNFEQATHAPLIIYAPGLKPSKTESQTEFVDIFPTLCELTGVKTPENLDGVSVVQLMKEPSNTVKKYSVSQYNRSEKGKKIEGYSIRTNRYRYTEWLTDFKENHIYDESKIAGKELYDYNNDPLETVSRIDDPGYKEAEKELKGYLMEYFASQKYSNK
jgi:iduronate 2-sulfatase